MDRSLAAEFAAKHREFDAWFGAMTELSHRVTVPDPAKSIRRTLGEMLFALDLAVRLPLRKEHPDLFADFQGRWQS